MNVSVESLQNVMQCIKFIQCHFGETKDIHFLHNQCQIVLKCSHTGS